MTAIGWEVGELWRFECAEPAAGRGDDEVLKLVRAA